MQRIRRLSGPSDNRPKALPSRRPRSPDASIEDRNADRRPYTLLHDSESVQKVSQQRRAYLERPGSDRMDQGLVDPVERSSSTCVSRNQPESSHLPVESHPDHTSPCSRSTAKHSKSDGFTHQRHVPFFRYWKWEILSILTSLALLAGVLATLANYNHGKQPEWPLNININSLISVLTAMIISQLGFILAEVIGQLKWSWFRQSHPLQDLQRYDSASRGILGSLFFLGRFARQPRAGLALGAAFIFLMSAAIGPFTQQSIQSYPCQLPLHNIRASIAAANSVDPTSVVGRSAQMYRYPDFKMMSSILDGIVGLANNSRTVQFNCTTGNCNFDPYSSLGYCSSCTDITSHVQEQHALRDSDSDDLIWNYTLPGQECRLSFADSGGHPLLSTPINGSSGNSMNIVMCSKPAEDLIDQIEHRSTTTFTIMSTSWANCSRDHDDGYQDSPGCGGYPEQLPSLANQSGLVAMNCTLGLCVREYSGYVSNGTLYESTTSSVASALISDQDSMFKILKLPCTVDSNKYDISNISQVPSIPGRNFTTVSHDGQNVTVPLECVFSTGEDVPWAISQFIQTESCRPPSFEDGQKGGCAFILSNSTTGSLCYPWYFEPVFRAGRPTAATISSDMENIAVAISNRMRNVGSNAYMNGTGVALGTAIQTTVCVRVDWPWLVFPAALVLLTVVLFVTVLIKARQSQILDGQPIWKSSAIVAFFHGIDERCHSSAFTGGGIAHPVTSAHEPGNLSVPSSLLRGGSYENLITLDGMHDKAKNIMVKLQTVATGKGGFVVVNEEDGERPMNPNKHHRQRRPSEFRYGGEALPLTQLPSNSSLHEQPPTHVHVDLGFRLTPSRHDSLDHSAQRSA